MIATGLMDCTNFNNGVITVDSVQRSARWISRHGPYDAAKSQGDGALLFMGDFNGTLAAARCLGRKNIDVALADSAPWSLTRASRYVRRFERLPSNRADDLIQWLIDRGRGNRSARRRPSLAGRVLFPGNDEQVFLFAQHRSELSSYYRLFQPSLESIYRILNKQKLYEACDLVGLDHPATWYPCGEEEVEELARKIDVQLMIKPRSQIQFRTKSKGVSIPSNAGLLETYRRFVTENPYGPDILAYDKKICWPMLQAFHSCRTHRIYGLSGFVDSTGRAPAMLGAKKLLQSPRNMGVGVCFESATVDRALAEKVQRLCSELRYVGIFDLEFVENADKFLLLDFNPRAYGQMGFEIARGLPLPYLHYLAALDDQAPLTHVYEEAGAWASRGDEAYCDSLHLALISLLPRTSRLVGGLVDVNWRSWTRERRTLLVDAVRDPEDPGPARLNLLRHCLRMLRHPRRWTQKYLAVDS